MLPQKMSMSQCQFRIGDLAKELKVKKFVIRFWEKEFGIKSDRSQGGQRFYSEQDLHTFLLIKDLLYQQGFTIAGAKKQLPVLLKEGAVVKAEAPVDGEPGEASVETASNAESLDAVDSDEDALVIEESVQTVQAEAVFAIVPVEAGPVAPVVQIAVEQVVAAPAVEPESERMMAATTVVDTTSVMGATNASPVETAVEEVALETEEDLEAATAFGSELDEDMVHPATKESCPCSHVHDQLSSFKAQLLELKALLER